MERITVAEAAKLLEISEETVRYGMELGQLPIGRVVCRKGSHRRTFLIYKERVYKLIGRASE